MGILLEKVIAALIPNYHFEESTNVQKRTIRSSSFFFLLNYQLRVRTRVRTLNDESARSCFRRKSACCKHPLPDMVFAAESYFCFVVKTSRESSRNATLNAERECHSWIIAFGKNGWKNVAGDSILRRDRCTLWNRMRLQNRQRNRDPLRDEIARRSSTSVVDICKNSSRVLQTKQTSNVFAKKQIS